MFAEGFIIYISVVVVGSSVLLSSFVLCCPVCPSSHRCHSLAFHRSRTLLLSFYRLFLQIGCAHSVALAYTLCVYVCVVSSSSFTSFDVALGVVVDAISTSHYFIYCSFRSIFAVSLVARRHFGILFADVFQ